MHWRSSARCVAKCNKFDKVGAFAHTIHYCVHGIVLRRSTATAKDALPCASIDLGRYLCAEVYRVTQSDLACSARALQVWQQFANF